MPLFLRSSQHLNNEKIVHISTAPYTFPYYHHTVISDILVHKYYWAGKLHKSRKNYLLTILAGSMTKFKSETKRNGLKQSG